MKSTILISALLLSLLAVISTAAYAESFRCHTKLVMEGDSTYAVKEKCGLPTSEEQVGYVMVGNGYVNLTRYFYDLGSRRLLVTLDFHNGVLQRISFSPR
ncbi:DUF2845 domain-containing protein [Aliiglaciecola sp. CAU 1673]|uniref:DUF2845 domain-containing protein n=1 Tax=Aliiglaciecola sp. CAU 1673 TaxID=3032595 RepID=UPI0023DC517D|nr:DUF2845 domain-containing protein [Aliiglaciecola sp. CAU 1673]MDF2180420.1 DUF2845 domain-containing protein [Aliiglaciecola sp. CAU 1673]